MPDWLSALKREHEALFHRDWAAHVAALNDQLPLTAHGSFRISRWAPAWFQGDIEHLEPGHWVAVLSLNPRSMSPKWTRWFEDQEFTPDSYWEYMRRTDLRGLDYERDEFFSAKFDGPLIRLIARALGETIEDFPTQATYKRHRMVSFECVPYASDRYELTPDMLRDLIARDPGCRLAFRFTQEVIAHGRPTAVLLNGRPTVPTLITAFPSIGNLREVTYPSDDKPGKMLTHWEGTIPDADNPIPIIAFRHLRTRRWAHNSDVEIAQLGNHIARFVNGSAQ